MKNDLGRFVVSTPRADGTFRVRFIVPPKLRPPGWPATIPLPIGHGRRGDLGDELEYERIRADASRLYANYTTRKAAHLIAGGAEPTRDIEGCVRLWQKSQEWKATAARTKKGYDYDTRIILRWATKNAATVETLGAADVEAFLALYDDRPSQRYSLGKTLRVILRHGVRARWIIDNPASHVRLIKPKTKVTLWTGADVDRLSEAANCAGQPGLAAIIRTQWEIGQRLTDVIRFRHGAEYDPVRGEFRFSQSKTGQPVAIPVSRGLRGILASCSQEGSPYLFHDGASGRPFRDVGRLWHVFKAVRPAGDPLVLRALRHSCVVELAKAGCEIPEIVAISGHALASAHAILQSYLPRDSTVARNAQRKRGLV